MKTPIPAVQQKSSDPFVTGLLNAIDSGSIEALLQFMDSIQDGDAAPIQSTFSPDEQRHHWQLSDSICKRGEAQ